jgi:Xaa-Pro aminopeptidase
MTVTRSTDRADQLAALLPGAELDVLLVTDLVNVRYLTGYTGSNGLALIGTDLRAFVTDFRYLEQAAAEIDPSFDRHRGERELLAGLAELFPSGELRMGFEEANLSFRKHRQLRDVLPDRVELVPVDGLVERLRQVKDSSEVARIREAARVADAAFAELLEEGLIGRTEQDVAFALFEKMHRHGGDRPSFDTRVAAGTHGALPHAMPRDREIGRRELVVVDWGVQLDGYCSDCTRTLAAGEPGAAETEVYAIVLEAQLTALRAIRAGVGAREIDSAARDVITAAGYGEYFGHSVGHGVGLAIHEGPTLRQRSDAALRAANVVTVEPGIYLAGRFGVRIEDLLIVTEQGSEILTSIGKELTTVG